MALAITGAVGAFAPSAATTKSAAAQASGAGLGNNFPYYHFIDAGGQPVSMRQSGPNDGPGANVLEFVAGGQQGSSLVRLTQQNLIDLIAGMVTFANTGTLS